jgi:enoyl-[acyl-carrier protein] reductase I
MTEEKETSIPTGTLMKGKRGLIMGLANDKSIAWGISQYLHAQGAELAFTFQGEALEKRVRPLAASLGSTIILPGDVTDEASMDNLFAELEKQWGKFDFLVHAIGFSDKNELTGKYLNTSKQNFLNSMNISVFSFTDVIRRSYKMMNPGGSYLTLTYLGAERVMPHYNVMGLCKSALETSVKYLAVDLGEYNIRCNAISAGPIKTLAASGIGDFRYILKWNEHNSPLKRNTTIEDVGGAAVFLLSELGSGTTGENVHVDSGYHVVGMKAIDAPDISLV